jgi:hypothetical protein
MTAPTETSRSRGLALPFVWLLLTTTQIKVDNEEAIFPFFRLAIFVALPFALIYFLRSLVFKARFTMGQWRGLMILLYLVAYPFATIAFGGVEARSIKDALYVVAIHIVLFFLVKRHLTDSNGDIDIDRVGRLCIRFALFHATIALLMYLGLVIWLPGFGVEFRQMAWLDGRLHGLLGTPSHLAPVLAIACLFLVTQPQKPATTAALAFLFAVLVMTGSRGALLGLFGAGFAWMVVRAQGFRLRVRGLITVAAVAVMMAAVSSYFATQAQEFLQTAVRSDPADWEKSRPVMWALRLAEFTQADPFKQLFGAGHRTIGQTFNANVEFLVNYGLIYVIIFNACYAALLWRFTRRARVTRERRDVVLLMIAVFIYLFAQGINFILHQFVHVTHLGMVVVLFGLFTGRKPTRAAPQPIPGNDGYERDSRRAAA